MIYIDNIFIKERLYDALALMLFITWPIANFVGFNSQAGEIIQTSRFVVFGLIIYLLSVVITLFISLFFKSSEAKTRVFWIFGFLMLINLAYMILLQNAVIPILNLFVSGPKNLIYTLTGLGIIATIGVIILSLFSHRAGFRLPIISILILTSLFSIYPAINRIIFMDTTRQNSTFQSSDVVKKIVSAEVKLTDLPNVYLFVLDGFVRQDILKKLFGVNSTEHMKFMKSRGFYIADQSHSNYPVTVYSHMAAFTMDFNVREGTMTGLEVIAAGVDKIVSGSGPISKAFRNRGYKVVWTKGSFWPAVHCGGTEDVCIKHANTPFDLSLSDVAFLKSTLLYELANKYFIANPFFRKNNLVTKIPLFMSFFDDTSLAYKSFKLSDIPNHLDQLPKEPFFWFAHNISVHNPAVDSDCNFRHWMQAKPVWPQTERIGQAFADSTKCAHKRMKVTTDAILKRDPTAIIIYIADHGSNGLYGSNTFLTRRSFNTWDSQDVAEQFGILNLIRFPKRCQNLLYPSISTINTMRIIFSCIDGKEYPLVEDVSYTAAYAKWFKDFPKVKKFVHGKNKNYPDAVEGTSPGYTEDTKLATMAKSYYSQIKEIRALSKKDFPINILDHPNLGKWKIRPNVILPTVKGSKKVTVAFWMGVTSPECMELSFNIYRRPYSDAYIKISPFMWTDKTKHHTDIQLSSLVSLTNRDIGCVRVKGAKKDYFFLYATLPHLSESAGALKAN